MLELILKQSSDFIEFLLLNSIYALLLAILVLAIKFTGSILIPGGLSKRVEYGLWCVVLVRLILPSELSFDYAISGAVKEWLLNPAQSHFLSEFIAKASGATLGVQSSAAYSLTSSDIVYCVWLAIVSLVLMRYLLLRFKLLSMINRAQPIVEYPLVALANRWRLNFWIKRPVHVIAEDKYLSPFTFFFKSPIIFIPRKILATRNEELIESIIAHEMAHVKRQDSLWLLFQNVIQIIYFFNPLVWLVVRRLSGLRENICDDMVLSAKQIEPEVYGNSLLQVLRFNISGEFGEQLSNAFLGYKGQIKHRIAAIGNFSVSPSYPKLDLIVVMLFGIFFLPFTQKVSIQSPSESLQVVKEKNENSPFPEDIRKQVKLPVVERDDE